MSSEKFAIEIKKLNKWYEIYARPHDRLKQFLVNKLVALKLIQKRTYFHEFKALSNISFNIKKGETVGVIGKNGSGKSTLLQIISQTVAPTSGNIIINGRIAALLELGAGFNPEFTGRENLYLNALISGLSVAEIESKISEILSFADIGDFIDRPVKTYSTGMFMRLAFSVQAHIDPDILIIDEALAVGDAFFIHKCMGRFHDMKKKGVTILLVTHDSTAIKTLCDRAIWIKNGEIAAIGEADHVVEEYLADTNGMVRALGVMQELDELEVSAKDIDVKNYPLISPTSRWGTQGISIRSACLVKKGKITDSLIAGDAGEIEIVAQVNEPNLKYDIIIGYTLKNIRGIDIASSNNEMEHIYIHGSQLNDTFKGRIQFSVPYLHPGEYTFTLNFSYRDHAGNIISLDHCENVLNFNLVSKKPCHVLMTFPSNYEFPALN